MERSGSQKALLVISIIEIIFSAFGLAAALMAMMGAGLLGSVGGAAELTADEQAMGVAVFSILAIVLVITSVWGLLCGIFGVRAANDNQKIMVVWVFAIIGIVIGVVGLIASIVQGSFGQQGISLILSLVIDVLIFWIANNIKREAGK